MKRKIEKVVSKGKEPVYHEMGLLTSRVLMALIYYLDYSEDSQADEMISRVYKDYRKHQTEVKKAVENAWEYLTKIRYQEGSNKENPSKERIRFTKNRITELARAVWKISVNDPVESHIEENT